MFNRFFSLLALSVMIPASATAMNIDNPFGKNETLTVGKEVPWQIDKDAGLSRKTANHDGQFYHLIFNNSQLELVISEDEAGEQPKTFTQLEVKDVQIDGKQSMLFKWCLSNQSNHSRFLQQGLTVRKNICSVDGGAGSFKMQLNKETMKSLLESSRLTIVLKPFRTPLEIKYDTSDFSDMVTAMNARPEPVKAAAPAAGVATQAATPKAEPAKKCWAGPPAEYQSIKPVEYDCNDAAAKKDAEAWVVKLVNQEKDKQKKLAAERERQRKLAEEKRKKQEAERLALEKQKAAEAAAIAASKAKQAELNSEITEKMVGVCSKFWDKGEHRCYCQKYISFAPAEIQANSTCE
jgi:hypothetical protein